MNTPALQSLGFAQKSLIPQYHNARWMAIVHQVHRIEESIRQLQALKDANPSYAIDAKLQAIYHIENAYLRIAAIRDRCYWLVSEIYKIPPSKKNGDIDRNSIDNAIKDEPCAAGLNKWNEVFKDDNKIRTYLAHEGSYHDRDPELEELTNLVGHERDLSWQLYLAGRIAYIEFILQQADGVLLFLFAELDDRLRKSDEGAAPAGG